MEDIALGNVKFDRNQSAEYAKEHFSQTKVSGNYIKIFEQAIKEGKEENKKKETDINDDKSDDGER